MAPLGRKMKFGLLLLICITGFVKADDINTDEEATVEVEEDDQYISPKLTAQGVYLTEHFDDEQAFKQKWVQSEAKKQGVDENIAKYDGKWAIQAPSKKILKHDLGLVLTTEAKHAAISTLLDKPFEFKDKPLVVQYEVTMQEGQNCGGAYVKLLSKGTNTKADLRKFFDQTPYTIMFGPDKCGNDNKLHFIFRHKNPKNGTIEEKHSKKPSQRLDDIYKDKEPHLYTLIVRPDNTFSVLVDNKEVNSGSLLEDFTPPVNPPEEIEDPDDKKPDDWDEREKIVDPTATKPEDWDESEPAQIVDPNAVKPDGWLDDEPEMIFDPEAKKPSDWDDEMDGEWEAPLIDNPKCSAAPGCGTWTPPTIPNPKYKGVWRAPLIPNPNYKGKWSPRRIPNPHYFKDDQPFKMTPIHAIGFELWSMSPQLLFDNVLVTDDPTLAQLWAEQTFELKRAKISRDSDSFLERALKYAGENTWVYAVVIIGSFVFVGIVAYMCCGPKSDSYGEMKKTDAVAEEDPHQSEQESEDLKDSKDENEPVDDVKEETKENVKDTKENLSEQETVVQEKPSKADLEGPEVEEIVNTEDTAPLVDNFGAGDGQRKRKPRKE